MFEEIALGITLFSLIVLIWALTQISGLRKIVEGMRSKIDVMSAPADTLTQVATAPGKYWESESIYYKYQHTSNENRDFR